MTEQEAIDLLDNLKGMIDDSQGNDYDSAFNLAINSMKCLDEIATLYIKHRTFGEYPTTKEEYADETIKILDKYKIEIKEKEDV